MRLYLVQHGLALPKGVDSHRPLSKQGQDDVRRVAAFLARIELRVGAVVHSGKTRARQTAEILAAAVSGGSLDTRGDLNANDPVEAVAKEAEGWTVDTILVGHLPFIARLTSRLVAGSEDQNVVEFQPGSVVCLERTGEGGWVIAWMIRPELLTE